MALTRLISTALAGALATTASAGTYNGYEIPPYSVVVTEGAVELREYAPHLAIEYRASGSRSQAVNRGFRALAGYIFGGNETGEKIAMTAPVAQAPADGAWDIRFIVPSDYSADDLPDPKNAEINTVQIPANRQLVYQFSGRWSEGQMTKATASLQAYARAKGFTLGDGPFYYFYDDPMTLPWKRRNEVAFIVKN